MKFYLATRDFKMHGFTIEKKNPTFRITGQNWMTYDVTVIVKGLVVYNIVTCTCTCTCKNIVLLN